MLLTTANVVLILGVFAFWLVGLTLGLYLALRHYQRLVDGSEGKGLKDILDKILDKEEGGKEAQEKLEERIRDLEKDGTFHIQKVGLIRFNPFRETGGDQSFSLALLDANESGFVLTCLHTRERTRIYVKPVKKGQSEYQLSNEERKTISAAVRS